VGESLGTERARLLGLLLRRPVVNVLSSVFATDDETRAKLLDLLFDIQAVGSRVGMLGSTTGQRKLVQLSRVLSALTSAVMFDDEARSLDGADQWALGYLDGRAKDRNVPEIRHRPRTVQEAARAIRTDLDAMKSKGTSREAAAAWLAERVALAMNLTDRPTILAAVVQRMPHKTTVAPLPSEPFKEDVERTIVAAFKAGGLGADKADQLFKARR